MNCGNPCTQSCACMEQRTFRPRLYLPRTQQEHSKTFPVDACAFRCCPGGMGWAERRAASSSYQTFSSFHSTAHCTPVHQNLYAPTAWPRQKILLGLSAKLQTWTLAAWLWPGPDSQLSKLSFRGAPSSTTPCPSPSPDTAGLPG